MATGDTGARRGGAVGAVLDAWMRQERVTIAYILRASGLARNTVSLILNGTTTRPSPETLTKLALALATDPYTSEVDSALAARALAELRAAAGYAGPDDETAGSLLRLALWLLFRSNDRVAAWESIIRRYSKLASGDVLRLRPPRVRA